MGSFVSQPEAKGGTGAERAWTQSSAAACAHSPFCDSICFAADRICFSEQRSSNALRFRPGHEFRHNAQISVIVLPRRFPLLAEGQADLGAAKWVVPAQFSEARAPASSELSEKVKSKANPDTYSRQQQA